MISTKRQPDLFIILQTFLGISLIIGMGIYYTGPKLHVPLIFCVVFLAILKYRLGYSWQDLENEMFTGISKILRVLLMFVAIGMLMGVWMAGGTVPTIVYYGIILISPSFYLVSVFVIMALISYAMGTSIGAVGTVGIALMMVGGALGVPADLGAGAIVSGAYFGDRTSPLAATLNITAVITVVPIYRIVKDLFLNILPALAVTGLLFFYLGLNLAAGEGEVIFLEGFISSLTEMMHISLLFLLSPILLIILAYRKIPIIINIFSNLFLSIILAVLIQKATLKELVSVMYYGYTASSGDQILDSLLNRGGIINMLDMIVICLILAALSGLIEGGGFLNPLIEWSRQRMGKRTAFPAAMVVSVLANMISGSQVFAIMLTGTIYNKVFDANSQERSLLARAIADGGTILAPLIPWNLNGLFMAGLLGVTTFSYSPYAFLCWLTPLFTLIWYVIRGVRQKMKFT